VLFMTLHPENQLQTTQPPKPTASIYDNEASESVKAIREILSQVEPGRFYFKSSDKNGHGEYVKTRIPTHWNNAIAHIIEKTKGYKCRSDFFRDAIVHRIAWLCQNVHEIDPHEIAVIASEFLAEKEITDGIAFEKMRSTVDRAMAGLVKRKDYAAAFVLIEQLKQAAEGMNTIYRRRILKRLDRYEKRIEAKREEKF
jgi:hypothetical protein